MTYSRLGLRKNPGDPGSCGDKLGVVSLPVVWRCSYTIVGRKRQSSHPGGGKDFPQSPSHTPSRHETLIESKG